MRDPSRIPEVIDVVREYWESHPDMRLTQILWNFSDTMPDKVNEVARFYNMEDDVLADRISQGFVE